MKKLRKFQRVIAFVLTLAMFSTMPTPTLKVDAAEVKNEQTFSDVSVLAANVYYEATGENVFTPYTIKELTVAGKNLKVGILGIENTDCSRFDVPDNYPGMVFAHPDNKKLSISWEVNRYVPQMKAAGCDFIVVSYHAGLGTAEGDLVFEVNTENQVARMISETEGVDIVVAGHDHSTNYSNTYIKNKNNEDVLVVNGGGSTLTNTVFEVKYDEKNGFSIGVKSSENLDLSTYQDDTGLAELMKPAVEEATKYVNQQYGTIKEGNWTTSTNFYLEQTDTMDLINRAQMAVANKYLKELGQADIKMSSTSVVVNGNYTVQPGDISLKDIYRMYKYDNYLYVVPLTGKEIRTWLEGNAEDHFSYSFKNGEVKFATAGNSFTNPVFYGIDFEYDLAKEVGNRIVGLKFKDGSLVKENETYNVAVNSYHIGQDPFTRTGKTTEDAIWSSRDALGDDKGLVQQMIGEFIKDCTEKDGGVTTDPSNWKLTYSGEIPEEDVTVTEPVEIFDPIADDVITKNDALSVKDAAEKQSGTGSVVGQVVYKYNNDKAVILEDVVDGQIYGYQVYDSRKEYDLEIGSIVKVTGLFGDNYGVPQITPSSVEVIEALGSEFAIAPQVVTVSDLGEDLMNEYVTIKDATLGASDGSYMTVKDETGSIKIYSGATTSLAGSKKALDITGVCSYYSTAGTYQLRVGSANDYIEHTTLDPVADEVIADDMVTLDQVYAADAGKAVTTAGQVVYKFSGSNGAEGNKTTVILQDVINGEIVGLQVYAKDLHSQFYVGDVVKVTGTVGANGGVKQITPSSVERVAVKTNFQPQTVEVKALGEDYLSEYIKIESATLGSYNGSGSTTIKQDGNTVAIYKGAAYPSNLDSGDTADVEGICSAYNGTYQLRVGSSANYKKKQAAEEKPENTSVFRIPVYETSDVHGNLVDTSSGKDETYQYRLARLADVVDDVRAENRDALLLDGGDIYQGTPLSNLQNGEPMIAAYDAMEYDAVSLGNHEFDWEVTELIDSDGTMGSYHLSDKIKGDSQIPVVCNNMYSKETGKRVDFTQDYTIVEKTAVSLDGKTKKVKVAIIGYVDDYSKDIMAAKIAPYSIHEDIQALEGQAAQIKTTGEADIVVVLTHAGASAIANQLDNETEVDLVLGGHTHQDMAGTAENGVPYAQPKNAAQSYVYAELCIDPNTNDVTVEKQQVVNLIEDKTTLYDTEANKDNLADDVVEISKVAIDIVKPILEDELGYITTPITKDLLEGSLSSTAGMWISDLMNRATGSKVSFTNNGGIRTSFVMEEGATTRTVTKGDIYTIAPFNNTLYVYDVDYAKLKEALDFTVKSASSMALRMSGVTAYFKGETVHTIILDGTTIYENGTWIADKATPVRICTNQYVGTSAGTPFANWTPVETSAVDNESFMAVLQKESAQNNGFLNVSTTPNMIEGDYVAAVSTLDVEEESAEFVLMTTTDMHGKCWNMNILNDTPVNNSLLRVATAVKAARAQYGDNVVLIDNGDLFQGTPISSYNIQCGGKENPMAIALKYIGYDVFVLGNHEFNYSYSTMQKIYEYLQSGNSEEKPEPTVSVTPSISPSVKPSQSPSASPSVKPSVKPSTPVTKVKVTLDANRGYFNTGKKPVTLSKTVTVKGKYGTLTTPVRKGYVFKGWYPSKTSSKKVTSSTTVTNTKTHTLYARWIKVTASKTAITSLTNTKSKNVVVKMKKVSDAKGYQIIYSRDKGFKKSKTVTTSSTTKTLTGLVKGQKYYFKVRTYKVDSTGARVYSGWSSVKTKVTAK